MRSPRKSGYVNVNEDAFHSLAKENGWIPSKRGWPDFFCWNPKTGEFIVVEVKPRTHGRTGRMKNLRHHQVLCMKFLSKHGIRCFVSDGYTLEKFNPDKHRVSSKML